MENCTVYSHKVDFDKVVQIVKTHVTKADIEVQDGGKQKSLKASIKGGFFGKTKTLSINYRERLHPSYKLDKVECGLTQNLAGMVNFIQSLPANNETVRSAFLHKVMAANVEMPFIVEPSFTDEFVAVLRQISKELETFIFTNPNSLFSRSQQQHFVDENFGLILDTTGQCDIDTLNVQVDAKYHDPSPASFTEAQIARKNKSDQYLASKGIKVNKNLPCMPDASNTHLRSKMEMLDRAYSLLIIAAYGEGVPRENLERPIHDKGIRGFSPRESQLLATNPIPEDQKAYATWRYESLYTILWALGLEAELKYPNEICDVQGIVGKVLQSTREELEQQITMRHVDEVLDMLDQVYRMNWACVDARIKGAEVGGGIHPSIIYERHYALNWITQYMDQDWDSVQTNT